jgi:hypothetical protein
MAYLRDHSPNRVEKLPEKGMSDAPTVNLAGIRRSKRVEKHRLGGLQGYAASTSEAFRTVSEDAFSEVRMTLGDRSHYTRPTAPTTLFCSASS